MAGSGTRKPRRRTALGPDVIAREAMALVNDEGLEGFSYRKLAKRLKCEAMSLYHYYPSKAHLFDALIDICVAETPIPPAGLPLRERLHTFALAFRDTALRYPGFVRFWITHRLNHRTALAWLNETVGMFADSGLPDEVAARVFRTMSYWLMGAALDEASGYALGPSAADPVPAEVAARDFPAITRIGRHFGKDNHLLFFETGLNVLLDWMDDEIRTAERARQNKTA